MWVSWSLWGGGTETSRCSIIKTSPSIIFRPAFLQVNFRNMMKTKVIPFAVAVKVQTYKVVGSPVDEEGSYFIFFYQRPAFKKQKQIKTYDQKDTLRVRYVVLSLQAIISKTPRQLGSRWKHHHWPCQFSLRASHTVNTITRPTEWRQPPDRHMLSSECWQHRQVQTSMRALVLRFEVVQLTFSASNTSENVYASLNNAEHESVVLGNITEVSSF